MTSLLDVWDQLPDHERKIIGNNTLFKVSQQALARYAFSCLIDKRYWKYFRACHNDGGRFLGVECRCCEQSIVLRHKSWCAVPEVMTVNTKYVAGFLSDLELLDRPPAGWYGGVG